MRRTISVLVLAVVSLTFGYLLAVNVVPMVNKKAAMADGPVVSGAKVVNTDELDQLGEATVQPEDESFVPLKPSGKKRKGKGAHFRVDHRTADGGRLIVDRTVNFNVDPMSNVNIQMDVNLDGVKLEEPKKKKSP